MSNAEVAKEIHDVIHADQPLGMSLVGLTPEQENVVTIWHAKLKKLDHLIHQYDYEIEEDQGKEISSLYHELTAAAVAWKILDQAAEAAPGILIKLVERTANVANGHMAKKIPSDTEIEQSFEKTFGFQLSPEGLKAVQDGLTEIVENVKFDHVPTDAEVEELASTLAQKVKPVIFPEVASN